MEEEERRGEERKEEKKREGEKRGEKEKLLASLHPGSSKSQFGSIYERKMPSAWLLKKTPNTARSWHLWWLLDTSHYKVDYQSIFSCDKLFVTAQKQRDRLRDFTLENPPKADCSCLPVSSPAALL